MQNILTFDVEDWYQGLDIPSDRWTSFERRLAIGLEFILDVLAQRQIRATFFVLGITACEHSDLIRRIVEAGHEIAAHGWSHTPIYRQTREKFLDELGCSLRTLQDLSGQPIRGHRAAFFSITPRTLWALDELNRLGLAYDSSIFPIWNYRYGLPGAERFPHRLSNGTLWELPISTLRLGRLNLPFSGGFYARFWPYPFVHWAIRRLNRQGQPVITYFHPWEFDPRHPNGHISAGGLARMTHYYGLSDARHKLCALLRDFEWTTAHEFVRDRAERSH